MQTAIAPATARTNLPAPEHPAVSLISVVADMMALIVHVQASARLIEAAIRRDADDHGEAPDVVVLDDVTPRYAKVNSALSVCNMVLDAALQSLLGTLAEARKPGQRQEPVSHKSS